MSEEETVRIKLARLAFSSWLSEHDQESVVELLAGKANDDTLQEAMVLLGAKIKAETAWYTWLHNLAVR